MERCSATAALSWRGPSLSVSQLLAHVIARVIAGESRVPFAGADAQCAAAAFLR